MMNGRYSLKSHDASALPVEQKSIFTPRVRASKAVSESIENKVSGLAHRMTYSLIRRTS